MPMGLNGTSLKEMSIGGLRKPRTMTTQMITATGLHWLRLVGHARLYHLGMLIEAVDALVRQNEYLAERASRELRSSQLPDSILRADFQKADGALEVALKAIRQTVNTHMANFKRKDFDRRVADIPARFRNSGRFVDSGTFLYPADGA
jgi:hypothetical protein